jgi:hypothetical protein
LIEGAPVKGARLKVRIEPPGGRAMMFKPVITVFEPDRELRWLGRLVIPGIADGEHAFSIEPLPEERSLFTQHEKFSGLLVPLIFPRFAESTEKGFLKMNEALKIRAQQPPLDFL